MKETFEKKKRARVDIPVPGIPVPGKPVRDRGIPVPG